jgi:hypothetical protein
MRVVALARYSESDRWGVAGTYARCCFVPVGLRSYLLIHALRYGLYAYAPSELELWRSAACEWVGPCGSGSAAARAAECAGNCGEGLRLRARSLRDRGGQGRRPLHWRSPSASLAGSQSPHPVPPNNGGTRIGHPMGRWTQHRGAQGHRGTG